MNYRRLIRQIFPHAVMAIAICYGAWMMLVEPKMAALANYESQRRNDRTIQFTPAQTYLLGEHVTEVERFAHRIAELNDLSQDSSRLFATVMNLGEQYHVEIPSLQPVSATGRRAQPAQPASHDPQSQMNVSTSRLEFAAVGTFENVAAFIDALAEYSPFFRPHSLTIVPADDGPPPTVLARVSVDIITVTPPALIRPLKEVNHVD